MANFKTTIITQKGHALIAKLEAGTATSNFKKICTSDYDYSSLSNSQLEELTSIRDTKQTILPDKISVINKATVKVSGTLTNTELKTGYYIRTIALYAVDPDEGEILYSITPSTLSDFIPPNNGVTSSGVIIDLLTTVSNAENVSIDVDPNAIVSIQTFNDFKEEVNSQLNDIAISVKTFGAKGDGVTDDTENIQKAIDSLKETGGILFFPVGTYLITAQLTLCSNIIITGCGEKSIIQCLTGTSGNGINMLVAIEQGNILIENIRIQNSHYGNAFPPAGTFTGMGANILMIGCNNIEVSHIHASAGGGAVNGKNEGVAPIYLSCCSNSRINNNMIDDSQNGIVIDSWYNNNTDKSMFHSWGITIEGNTIDNVAGRGIAIDLGNGDGSLSIIGNTILRFAYAGIKGENIFNCVIDGNAIDGLSHDRSQGTQTSLNGYFGIEILTGGSKCVIANNSIYNLLHDGIRMLNSNDTVITGNNIRNGSDTTDAIGINVHNDNTKTINGMVITSNTITGMIDGINLDSSGASLSKCLICNNNINVSRYGITLGSLTDGLISSNIITGKTDYTIIGIYGRGTTTTCKFTGNLITRVQVGMSLSDVSSSIDGTFETCNSGINFTSANGTIVSCVFRNIPIAFTGKASSVYARKSIFIEVITIRAIANIFVGTIFASAIPTTGYWMNGDIVMNTNPSAGGNIGWVCTAQGGQGTWKPFGTIVA